MLSKKYKNVCRVLNYIEYLHILVSIVTGCVSISSFDSLVDIHKKMLSYCLKAKRNQSIKKEGLQRQVFFSGR